MVPPSIRKPDAPALPIVGWVNLLDRNPGGHILLAPKPTAEKRTAVVELVEAERAIEAAQGADKSALLANLRHAYRQLTEGVVGDPKAFADGLIAPMIRALEQEQ